MYEVLTFGKQPYGGNAMKAQLALQSEPVKLPELPKTQLFPKIM